MAKLYDADTVKAEELYSKMSLRQKIVHLWEYNKNYFWVVIFVIAVMALVYITWPEPTIEPNLRIKFINTYVTGLEEESNLMIEDYENYLGEENTCEMQLSYCEISPEDEMRADVNMEKVLYEVSRYCIELFICDEYAMNEMCQAGYVHDITGCLDAKVLEQVEERLVYYADSEGKQVPRAIDISDTEYARALDIQGEKVYILFAENLANGENAEQFVTYVLSK